MYKSHGIMDGNIFFGFNKLSNTDDILFIGIIRYLCNWANSLYRNKHHLQKIIN